ncbi:MAG: hypothetical protein ACI4I1_12280 [Oscillospiraceae bacterium]
MGSRGAFVDVNVWDFTFKEGGQHYKSLGILKDDPNVKVIIQDSKETLINTFLPFFKMSSKAEIRTFFKTAKRTLRFNQRIPNNVKAPEYSHTPGRIYAVVKEGILKHLAYYDENHNQTVSIDLAHEHNGVKPHRHVYLQHNKNDPGVPPTDAELKLIKKEFNLL